MLSIASTFKTTEEQAAAKAVLLHKLESVSDYIEYLSGRERKSDFLRRVLLSALDKLENVLSKMPGA